MAGEIVLTTRHILNLCEFAGIAVDIEKSVFAEEAEQLETEYEIAQNEYGTCSWLYESPEEGVYPLSGSPKMLLKKSSENNL